MSIVERLIEEFARTLGDLRESANHTLVERYLNHPPTLALGYVLTDDAGARVAEVHVKLDTIHAASLRETDIEAYAPADVEAEAVRS